ncbi:MAG: DUF2225 domain-containing protein [Hungatella sp.]
MLINLKELEEFSNVKQYHQGSIILKENAACAKEIFILQSGQVGIFKNIESTAPENLAVLTTGALFGEIGIFTEERMSSSAIALSEVEARSITRSDFSKFIKTNPGTAMQMVDILSTPITAPERILELQRERIPVGSSITITPELKRSLLPKGHKSYPAMMPLVYYDCMREANVTCPRCKKAFTTWKPNNAKLRGDGSPRGCDMRLRYADFDIVWNNIIICPYCYFSTLLDYFEDTSLIYKSPEKSQSVIQIRENLRIDFAADRTMDFVFLLHYMALLCAHDFRNEKQVTAKLWLQLTYLYSDAKDEEMYQYAVQKTLESYKAFYGNSDMRPEQEQVCCLIMGHLSIVLGDMNAAWRYLTDARMNKEGLPVYKRMADTQLEIVREQRRG